MSKRKARRRYVSKNRRPPPVANVKPSAMAEAKKRPWTMQVLLQRGPDHDGITAEQFEAAVEIVDGHAALTRGVGWQASPIEGAINRGGHHVAVSAADRISERGARLASVYLAWSADLLHRAGFAGHVVVEWVRDERPCGIDMVPFLVRALDLWPRHRAEWGSPRLTPTVRRRDRIDIRQQAKPLVEAKHR